MLRPNKTAPLFFGLSHIGQVFSTLWAKKIGNCATYDPIKINRINYAKKRFSEEEPNLKKIITKNKIINYNKIKEIKKHDIIFFTYDTPINLNDNIPNLKFIENNLKKLFSIDFKFKTKIIILSQVYPGFCDYIIKKYLKTKKIEVIYMVDTLRMGDAINKFLYPEQLIFGCTEENRKFILSFFSKFKCKKYIFSIKEAELIKISLNLFLFFSINYSNILDRFSRSLKIDFSKILECLRNDKRIGKHAYIHPSLGMSGGHLERDGYYLKKLNKDKESINIINNLIKFNDSRKTIIEKILNQKIKKKKIKILIMGLSYKKESFSVRNSIFNNIINQKKYSIEVFDSFFNLKKTKFKISENLNSSLKNNDVIIYNYSNEKEVKILKNFFKNNTKKYLINISLDNKEFIRNNTQVINIFVKENTHIA